MLNEPPPYTPVETVVSALGSPAKRSEYVDIDVDLRWLDTESSYNVKRGTKRELLKQITPVKKLLDFTYEGTVYISPPQSAKSDTKVTVEGSYDDLMTRIDAQVRDSMTAQSEAARKVIRKEKDNAIQEIMLMKEYERNFCILVWKRVIQDQVYERMAKALQIEDAKVEGYESLVNEYEIRYGKGSLTEEDIQHLRSPPERTKANELVHPKLGDARSCYQSLSRRLREDDDDEEMMRYRRYYELGTGDNTNYDDDDESVTGVTVDREGVAVDREGVAADEAVDV